MVIVKDGMLNTKVNGIKIKTDKPCASSNKENNEWRKVGYLVIHYTGNKKDTAKANANYFTTGGREASAHFFVDNTNIYQSVELRDVAWHCGGVKVYYHTSCRNSNSIGIEMCCTAGNYKVSQKTITNTAHLAAYLCKKYNIPVENIVRHYDVTHKQCPAQFVGEGSNYNEWKAFKNQVSKLLKGETIEVGDKVKLTSNATYYDGGKIPSWVKIKTLYVRDIKKDRVVVSTVKTGDITGAVNIKHLKKK